jgi:hypothetical protein
VKRKRIHSKTTRAELAAIVYAALKAELGDEPVLVGGAVTSIYTQGRYQSYDLDIATWRDNRQIRPVMTRLGFAQKGSYWTHPETELLVQFVNAPVMIGRKHVKTAERMRTPAGEFAIISPLDSACDRLAWYLDRGDAQSMEQCVDVVVAQSVSLTAIAEWLENEEWPERSKRSALALLDRRVDLQRKRRRKRRR